jgi:hypothetical protein
MEEAVGTCWGTQAYSYEKNQLWTVDLSYVSHSFLSLQSQKEEETP